MTTHDDTTGPANFGPEQGQGARFGSSGVKDTSDLKIGSTGPETPPFAPLPNDGEVALAARTALGEYLAWPDAGRNGPTPVDNRRVLQWLKGVPKALSSTRVDGVALLTIKLADVEAERDELARKVEALSSVRVFNVAGLVEADLAERYQSLRAAHDAVTVAVPDNWRETGAPSIEAHIVDLIGIAVSFMENLAGVVNASGPFKGWTPADDPAEFVIDAVNRITDAEDLHRKDLLSWALLWRPHDVDALIERKRGGGHLDGAEEAEIALWATDRQGRAIRFVAELATMTDVEADFTDGHELRSTARLLQVPDMDGEVEATLPRLYSDADRQRARDAVYRRFYDPSREPVQSVATTTGELVDLVAEALGMRRAGA